MEETAGFIYILTNPSFPEYVKIGYADDVEKRLNQLNRSECIPFAFRVYATYEVESRLSDKKIHEIIDKLNPNLRAIDNFAGKQRVREFYAMTKEDAYELLKNIAEINGRLKKLKLIKANEQEQTDEEIAERIEGESEARRGNQPISLEEYLLNKKPTLVKLFKDLLDRINKDCPETELHILPQYIGFKKGKYYYAEIKIQKENIRVLTLIPEKQYAIGESVPGHFLWTLKYRMYITNNKNFEDLVSIIKESYDKR